MNWRHATEPNLTTAVPDQAARPPGAPPPDGTPPPLAPWRKAVLGALFVVLVGGLIAVVVNRSSGDKGGAAAPAGSAPVPQTTVATSPAQSDQPPPLLNTGDDWDQIVRSIVAYDDWLHTHPHPELLGAYMHPHDAAFQQSQEALTGLANGSIRYDPPYAPVSVESVKFVRQLQTNPNVVLLLVRYGPIPPYRAVDASGKVVTDTPAKPGNNAFWTLAQTDATGPHWLLLKTEGA